MVIIKRVDFRTKLLTTLAPNEGTDKDQQRLTRAYTLEKKKPTLIRQLTNVQSVNGDPLKIDGYIYLKFIIGGTTMTPTHKVLK